MRLGNQCDLVTLDLGQEGQNGDAAGGEQGKLGETALGAFERRAAFEVVPDRLEQPAGELLFGTMDTWPR